MSLTFRTRAPSGLWLGLGLSGAAHLGAAALFLAAAAPAQINPDPEDPRLKGRDFIDLAPVEMLMAAPETDLQEGDPADDSKAALDTPEDWELAAGSNDPLLAQIPHAVEDPELQFRIANPMQDTDTEELAEEVPTEVKKEIVEEASAESVAAAPTASAGQDAASGSEEEDIGLSDEARAEIGAWQKELVLALAAAKTYPAAARKARAQGKVVVGFSLDRYGRIQRREVVESTGWPVLDKAALDLLDGFDRLPAPPAAMGAGPFDLRFPISYSFK